ncbi:hypothetical protein BgiMline_012829 [Biomphalaria glabrata]
MMEPKAAIQYIHTTILIKESMVMAGAVVCVDVVPDFRRISYVQRLKKKGQMKVSPQHLTASLCQPVTCYVLCLVQTDQQKYTQVLKLPYTLLRQIETIVHTVEQRRETRK